MAMLVMLGAPQASNVSLAAPMHLPGCGVPPDVDPDAQLLAMTAMYEATYQPELGRRLVMHVVYNRWLASGQPHLEVVLFQPGQFVAWTPKRRMDWLLAMALDDQAYFEAIAVHRLTAHPDLPGHHKRALTYYYELIVMAEEVLSGAPEPEGWEGAVYFDNPQGWRPGYTPGFALEDTALGCVGDHCFWSKR